VTVSNGVLHAVFPNGSPPEDTSDAIQGWFVENVPASGDLIVFDLFPNDVYLMGIDPVAGFYVYGLYNPLTGALTPQDTDLPGGLGSAPNHASISGNELILTTANGGQLTLQAIPEPPAIVLVGLGLVGLALMRKAQRSIPRNA
jgi:hypothetical protein